jgi:inner membrane protease subunit 2
MYLTDPYDYVIKRLVGVEGDVVVGSTFSRHRPVNVAAGSCWVEGDNRKSSVDSYSAYGPIPSGLIFGKATHVIWPPSRWRRLQPKLPERDGRIVEDIGGGNVKIVNAAAW